ncbi:aspartate--tRNA(Asn) ligase [Candidatus Pacearchaeota archaeon CG10_big_fil_rev_8_21_14_0_10_32_42]|nr:MAG: aspartate--tRNA(Asn) ligase [Candidatus Pacearchaeota archaeon CG10_big_fil_rev_8_21_14_0_10_32_42]
MERTLVKDLKSGKEIILKGWVYEIRNLAKLGFILLRDRSGVVQCVLQNNLMDKLSDLSLESTVEIKGKTKEAKVKADYARKELEVDVSSIEIISKAEQLPIHVNEKMTSTEFQNRLDYRFLDTRKFNISAIFKIRSSIYKNIVDFFDKEQFVIINTPKITTIGLESGAESFVVDYFGKKTVLAQSPQFYKQMFVNGGFERVMEIGQVYRAEKSHTTRHLTEFTGIDFEMGFIQDENDVMDVAEKMFKYSIEKIKYERKEELKLLNIDLKIPKKIPRISMGELKEILTKKGKKLSEDDDLDAEAEKMIGEYVLEKYGEEFVFITRYPVKVRPFYHMRQDDNPKDTRSFDLLWRGVEVATGAQREHRLAILQKQAKEKGIKIPRIYEDVFKFGVIPHGGVGLGLDRIAQRMLNLENIREGLLLTRDTGRVTP